jgi:hypothetical protein
MTETTPHDGQLHPAISHLLATLKASDARIQHGFGLWPVFAERRPTPEYLTLVEALSLDGFRITEVSEGGSVPALRVINETPQNILLFDGEELKGAKQNRILNTTILIAAGTSLDVPVSCTEQGRWGYQSAEFSSSGSLAHAELRKRKAESVAFSLQTQASHVSDQGGVWQEIEQLHFAAKTADKSRTRAMKDAYENRQRELDEFTRDVPCHDGQCGLLAVVGDRVEGIDVLSRPEAYARLHRRLVESHAMDFLVRKGGISKKPLDPEAPARFLAEAAKARETVHATPGLGSDHRLRFRWGYGAALRVEETIVHLALFGGRGLGQGSHPSEPPLLRRRRRVVE